MEQDEKGSKAYLISIVMVAVLVACSSVMIPQ